MTLNTSLDYDVNVGWIKHPNTVLDFQVQVGHLPLEGKDDSSGSRVFNVAGNYIHRVYKYIYREKVRYKEESM